MKRGKEGNSAYSRVVLSSTGPKQSLLGAAIILEVATKSKRTVDAPNAVEQRDRV